MLIRADARRIPLADETVQCVVTSPPYWGLRKYAGEQELVWGGAADCEHEWVISERAGMSGGTASAKVQIKGEDNFQIVPPSQNGTCLRCGAWRGAYGLEPTVHAYVEHTVEILREIRRVLRKDGVCFWNVGDSYAGSWGAQGHNGQMADRSVVSARQIAAHPHRQSHTGTVRDADLKVKDLCLIPHRVAMAAQADGWWVRSDIIWSKPNPMPESVRDRPTGAYEHVLMLTKSPRYYWDAEAVKEPATYPEKRNGRVGAYQNRAIFDKGDGTTPTGEAGRDLSGRNLRNVWNFATQPYSGAHFAVFPEELPRRCVLAASKVGDLVLDPFGGSGTTGRVATKLNRRAVLLDLAYSPDAYAPLAAERNTNIQPVIAGL